ncbi:hypothetical protein DSO57_1001673 [Entomophthora muscae]|uniref:Uncharacterized protein n=1 Tax=Entomophthora muscae TaxID=34485 RepID=A0ACC2TWD9_9FUNG|nr:hypothetical protein DSO57_1001673 [Entomophthora muscae]
MVYLSHLWGEISSSAQLVSEDPSSLWDLTSGLLFSGETVVKSLTCNNLDLGIVDHIPPASEVDVSPMPPLPSLVKSDSVPPVASEVFPPTCTPCLLTRLMLMVLNADFPQMSPVSSLWSPLQAAVPVLHWEASWWFVSPGWEPNLASLAPLSHSQTQDPGMLMKWCWLILQSNARISTRVEGERDAAWYIIIEEIVLDTSLVLFTLDAKHDIVYYCTL